MSDEKSLDYWQEQCNAYLDVIERLQAELKKSDRRNNALRAKIEAALALHTPFKLTGHEYMGQFCGHCSAETRAPWPCPTVKALRGENDEG